MIVYPLPCISFSSPFMPRTPHINVPWSTCSMALTWTENVHNFHYDIGIFWSFFLDYVHINVNWLSCIIQTFTLALAKNINAHKTSFYTGSPILYFVANPYKWIVFLARFPWVANFIFHLFVYQVVALATTSIHGAWSWTPTLPFSLTPYYTFICYNGILSIMYLHTTFVIEISGICTSPMNIWDMLSEQIIWFNWIISFLY
jgi:hypothetical protein